MKVVAAYLLAVLAGKQTPSAEDIKSILGSVGIEGEDDKIELLLSQVKGKDIAEIIASGREKLASVPSGGAVSPAMAGVSTAAGGGAPAADSVAAAPEKEEKKVEEESDEDMCFSLFD